MHNVNKQNSATRWTTLCSHVINGYIGAPSFLEKLAEVVKKMKELNPGLTYVCDPVMGDFGPGMYVPETLLPLYREVPLDLNP